MGENYLGDENALHRIVEIFRDFRPFFIVFWRFS